MIIANTVVYTGEKRQKSCTMAKIQTLKRQPLLLMLFCCYLCCQVQVSNSLPIRYNQNNELSLCSFQRIDHRRRNNTKKSSNDEQNARTLIIDKITSNIIRGGGSPLEPNPNYVDYNQFMSPRLGDETEDNLHRPYQQQQQYQQYHHHRNSNVFHQNKIKPLQQVLQEFMSKLYVTSPTLYLGIVSSIIVFIAWQIPPVTNILLKQHFVCSSVNILRNHYYHNLLTAAISHSSFSHLLMNLYGFYTFGRSVESTLLANKILLSAYCIISAIFSNLMFLVLTPRGSCIGLSGVALSLLALDAKLHPNKQIGFVIRFIPTRLPAQYALTGLLVWSVLGVVKATTGGMYDGIAHSVHLGGLIFGVLVYEALKAGKLQRFINLSRIFMYELKKKLK